jgi:hypothetical protein
MKKYHTKYTRSLLGPAVAVVTERRQGGKETHTAVTIDPT